MLKDLIKARPTLSGLNSGRDQQLLWLMYILSRNDCYLYEHPRQTRNAQKIVFKVPIRISPAYERTPYYIGTKLWNELDVDTRNLIMFLPLRRKLP